MDTLFMDVFSMFDTDDTAADFQPITAGHINHTYAVFVVGEQHPKYVLQKINTDVFQKPDELIANIKGVCSHIRRKIIERGGDPMRETLTLLPTKLLAALLFYQQFGGASVGRPSWASL